MFEEFKQNIAVEKEVINGFRSVTDAKERVAYLDQLRVLNNAVVELLKKTSPVKSVSSTPVNLVLVNSSVAGQTALVKKNDVSVFLNGVKSLKKSVSFKEDRKVYSIVRPSLIKSLSNKFFRSTAERLAPSFKSLSNNIKSANLKILPSTYIAIMLFVTFCSFFVGLAVYLGLLVFSLNFWTYFHLPPQPHQSQPEK